MNELVELNADPNELVRRMPAEAGVSQDIAFRIIQIVQTRSRPPMPDFSYPDPTKDLAQPKTKPGPFRRIQEWIAGPQ